MCITGHATGGGHLGVTVFATGGGGDTKNFFEKLIAFGVLQERWRTPKAINFSKKFFVSPPPRCEDSNTQMSPPPVACPVRHLNTSVFVRNQGNRGSQIKGDHIAAERGLMYMIIWMSDLFEFVNDLEKIIYGSVFKHILKRNNIDRALFRVNANPGAVANDGNKDI